MTATANAPIGKSAIGKKQDQLPTMALIGLFFAGFVGVLTEVLPAGLLPEMSHTLHSSIAATGQTVTLYAVATAIAAVPLNRLTSNWTRKSVVQVALLSVTLANLLTGLSSNYWLTLATRVLAGLSTALIWPSLAGYAARLSPERKQGRAITIAMAGIPVSLAFGIPLATAVTSFTGWQVAFYGSAVLTVLVMLWMYFTLPNLPGLPMDQRHKFSQVLVMPGVRVILLTLAGFMVAHYMMYTYITDFLNLAGMEGQAGWVLFVFGVTSVLSVFVVGMFIDRHLRKLVVASTVLLAVCALVMAVVTGLPVVIYLAAATWGLVYGSSATLFMAAIIKASGPAAQVGQSMVTLVFSISIALGGLFGGVVVDVLNTESIMWVALGLLAAASLLAIGGKKHAFPATK
ncbi:Predicted arabinose efflux permease, MFS family [Micromonospora avicenniae]|uniref:Predicted arabinose efflux permease, MFS family n=2 Tax=Micromonospora avicenniae TaxID=1198245 RepID=A0A1N7C1U4_9ACTN|nr:Predicted arabinose efflux permease, MFS family [Micromonospora avicenniae]